MLFNRGKQSSSKMKYKPDGRPYVNPVEEVDVNALTEDTIVCKCRYTTYGDILKAVSMGMTTLDEIIEETRAVSACQQCRKNVQAYLDHALEVANPFD